MVRADVLGVPRDPVGARDGHHRRGLHAAAGRVRDALRHDRRPPSQTPRHGGVGHHHTPGLPRRRCSVAGVPRECAARPRRPLVLDLLGGRARRRGHREHAQHRAVDDGDAPRPGGSPGQRQRSRRHGAGAVVRGHERVQRTLGRAARDGVDAGDRDRPHPGRSRSSAHDPNPGGAPAASERTAPRRRCARRDPGRPGLSRSVRAADLLDVQQPHRRRLPRPHGPVRTPTLHGRDSSSAVRSWRSSGWGAIRSARCS